MQDKSLFHMKTQVTKARPPVLLPWIHLLPFLSSSLKQVWKLHEPGLFQSEY